MYIPFMGSMRPADAKSVPAYWPAGGVKAGDGLAACSTDERGTLFFIWTAPIPGSGRWSWTSISTRGRRTLSAGSDSFHRQPGVDPCLQAALCAKAGAIPVTDDAASAEPLLTILGLQGAWRDEARELWDGFARAAGGATLLAGRWGSPDWLSVADARQGEANVESLLSRHPVLLGLLRHWVDQKPAPDIAALVDEACDPESPVRRIANATARYLAAFGPPNPDGTIAEARSAGIGSLLKRLGTAPVNPKLGFRACSTAGWAPRDWIPGSVDDLEAMAAVVEAATALADLSLDALVVQDLLAPVRGNWRRVADELAPFVSQGADQWAGDVRDMADALARQAIAPAVAHAHHASGHQQIPHGEISDSSRAEAWRLLFRGKGLLAIAEASRDWHVRGPAMTESILALASFRDVRWPRPFPDFTATNGYSIVPLLSEAALAVEGRELRHCVASYSRGCELGHYAILSVRDMDGQRSSTVQLSKSGSVEQHRGLQNGAPKVADRTALAELLAQLARERRGIPRPGLAGRIRGIGPKLRRSIIDRSAPNWTRDYAYDPRDGIRVRTASLLWERYLPRPSRGGIAELVAGVTPDGAAWLAKNGSPPVRLPRDGLAGAVAAIAFDAFKKAPDGMKASLVVASIFGALILATLVLLAVTRESRQQEAAAQQQYEIARQRMLTDDGQPRWGHVQRPTIPPGQVTTLPSEPEDEDATPTRRSRRLRQEAEDIGDARQRMLSDSGVGRWGHRRGLTPEEARAQQR